MDPTCVPDFCADGGLPEPLSVNSELNVLEFMKQFPVSDDAPAAGDNETLPSQAKSRKKMRREKRLEAKWLSRRAKRPLERKRTAGRRAEEKRRIAEEDPANFVSKRQERKNRRLRLEEGLKSGIRVAVDMSFCYVMSEKEITQLAAQVNFMYAATARSTKPFCLALTALEPGSILERELYRKCSGFDNYNIIRTEKLVTEYYDKNQLVYLSPDADECLESVEHDKVYVIGGIVDGTPKSRLTKDKAETEKIQARRLPIQEYMQRTPLSHNTILTLNQVYNILITFASCGDWAEALCKHVPQRKKFVLRNPDEDADENVSMKASEEDGASSANNADATAASTAVK